MTMFIFLGDMAVMAFMIGVAIWFSTSKNDPEVSRAACIPLEDEDGHG